jgi:hypothetical protein
MQVQKKVQLHDFRKCKFVFSVLEKTQIHEILLFSLFVIYYSVHMCV